MEPRWRRGRPEDTLVAIAVHDCGHREGNRTWRCVRPPASHSNTTGHAIRTRHKERRAAITWLAATTIRLHVVDRLSGLQMRWLRCRRCLLKEDLLLWLMERTVARRVPN